VTRIVSRWNPLLLRGQVTDVPMHDEELGPISRAEANEALANGTAEDVAATMIRLALHDPDPAFIQHMCLARLEHPNVWVRRDCATALGHVARLHGTLDLAEVLPALGKLWEDPDVVPWVEAAMDDIRMFIGPPNDT